MQPAWMTMGSSCPIVFSDLKRKEGVSSGGKLGVVRLGVQEGCNAIEQDATEFEVGFVVRVKTRRFVSKDGFNEIANDKDSLSSIDDERSEKGSTRVLTERVESKPIRPVGVDISR